MMIFKCDLCKHELKRSEIWTARLEIQPLGYVPQEVGTASKDEPDTKVWSELCKPCALYLKDPAEPSIKQAYYEQLYGKR